MEVVGESVLSAAVEVLFGKLASPELLKFARQGEVIAELENWKKELMMINEVLGEAEEKQTTKPSVKNWLDDLRDLAYDMEDVLDELATELLRRRLMAEGADQVATTSKVRSLIPTCFTGFNPVGEVRFNIEMGTKIKEITRRLDDISGRKSKLGFYTVPGVEKSGERFACGATSTWKRPPTTSLINEPVHGRDDEKEVIIEMLLKDEGGESNFGVIPIVGIGGMGKTTLAQLIYRDDEIVKHFEPTVWVCVSDESDVEKLTKIILNAVSPDEIRDGDDFNQVQLKLSKILVGKRFLLVLDDVWNINSYEQWRSKIVVTTRHTNVASLMRADNYHHLLKPLSNDDCWNVFVKHAFENKNINEHPNLRLLDTRIIEKCSGLPLAAKVLGGLLRSKPQNQWEHVLSSKMWNRSGVIPVLRLSYQHLPSHLKRCFAYCALFPRDYKFEQKELILLWIAEAITNICCVAVTVDNKMKCYLSTKVLHGLLPKLIQLRVLSLSGYEINELPNSIGDLKHLRYLNLSHTKLKWLPSVSTLYNLQSLILCNCRKLIKLPIDIMNLTNLRHLDIRGSIMLKEMPPQVDNLINLQTLSKFFLSKGNGDAMYVNLKERPNIEDLTMVWSEDSGNSRNESTEIEVLKWLQPHQSLKNWILDFMIHPSPKWFVWNSQIVKLHIIASTWGLPFLKDLAIEGMNQVKSIGDGFYGDTANPFQSLESLRFENMAEWNNWLIPKLGHEETQTLFPCLRELKMRRCPKLINLPHELPSLVVFRLSCLWERLAQRLMVLEDLGINECDELACLRKPGFGLENLGGLRRLWINGCDGVVSLEEQGLPCNLQYLEVKGCSNLEKLPNALHTLTSLAYMIIHNCPKLVSFPETGLPPMLRNLIVRNCEGLETLPDGMMINNCALEYLIIRDCPSLIGFPKGSYLELPATLQKLIIINCEKLESLPEGIANNNTCHLEYLHVWGCPSLKSIPRGYFPSTLETLSIWDCQQLESIPGNMQQNLTSLQVLQICNCRDVLSSPEAF
ncbi:hypothetical protein AAG906_020482 [Vitis piasezkii]